jgi:hypothetical protein
MREKAMNTMQRSTRKKKPGPNIVRAWFDTVFHYALRGLASEQGFLTRGNWTYRFHRRTLEYIAPLAEHLPSAGRENLEQFLFFFPAVGHLIEQHNHGVERLLETCSAFHASIINSSDFREVFALVQVEAPAALGGDFSSHFGAYSAEADFMGILAEYLVNNIEELPSHYSTARLWNQFRDRFVHVAAAPELAPYRHDTEASGQELLRSVDELNSALKATRSELSLDFDLPYVAETASVR